MSSCHIHVKREKKKKKDIVIGFRVKTYQMTAAV